MLHILEGRIGSGKTYYIVSWLLARYYEWQKYYWEWFPKSGEAPKIWTNVKDLNLSNVHDITRGVQAAGSLREFFSVDPVTLELKNKDLANSIIIIDEAQGPFWFPRAYKDAMVTIFFQYHRHYGCEIWLVCQDIKSLCPDLRELPEYHLRAVRQSLHIGPYFRYQKFYDDESGARILVKKDERVFAAYKSVEKGAEVVKVKSALARYVVFFACGMLVFIGGAWAFKHTMFRSPHLPGVGVAKVKEVKSVPIAYIPPVGIVVPPVSAVPAKVAVPVVSGPVAAETKTGVDAVGSYDNESDVRKHCRRSGEVNIGESIVTTYQCSGRQYRFRDGYLEGSREIRKPEALEVAASVPALKPSQGSVQVIDVP